MERVNNHLRTLCILALLGGACCLPRQALTLSDRDSDLQYKQEIMRLAKRASMHNLMNENVEPCEDFYAFACGKWKRNNPANSASSLTTGLFETMSSALDHKVAKLLAGHDVAFNYTAIDRKVKDFYLSCTKIGQLDDYVNKLFAIIAEFGEMPALSGDQWTGSHFDWMTTVAQIAHKYGQDIILSIDIMPDFRDNTINRIYIGHADLPLESRSMYLDNSTHVYREHYKAKIASELRKFLVLNATVARETAKEIVDFQVSLAQGMVDESLGLGIEELSKLTSIAEMQSKYAPTIDIAKFVNITLGELVVEPIYEYVESFQDNLMKVIARTPKRIVANYIFYSLLNDFMLDVESTREKQDKSCIEKTKSYFAKNVDNMVYRKYNTKETERDVEMIWSELKDTFKETLLSDKLRWIDLRTRQYAIQKLDALTLEINSYKDHNFTEEFGNLTIDNSDYVENIKHILQQSSERAIAELHAPPKPLEAGEILSYTPANILIENKIKVPVSLLQPYYLWFDIYPNALKFGTLGALVGHELIHAFDDTGRKFDKDGNSNDWWDEKSTGAFIERTRCFSQQYSQYVYDGRLLPMSVSQSENIADNGGVRLAYKAYLRWHQDAVRSQQNLTLEVLPKMNYSSKQLFFISFAQVWCNDVHPQVKHLQTSTDQHVPGEFRVIGSLSNFDEFAKEFNCAAETRMNPKKKCEIY